VPNASHDLERFVAAQRQLYSLVLDELRAGAKRSHWMWFIFPQVTGLGLSPLARQYAIANLAEARAYLGHELLGLRLVESTEAVLEWRGQRTAEQILGQIDAMKFRSSMTLFEAAGGDGCFARALEAFFAGSRDERTLQILAAIEA